MGQERRRDVRVEPSRERPIDVQIMGTDFLERVRAIDISLGGLAIRVKHAFVGHNVTDRVELVLTLPGEVPFLAEGYIRHKSGAATTLFGVEFSRLPDKGRERIQAFVNRQLTRTGQPGHR